MVSVSLTHKLGEDQVSYTTEGQKVEVLAQVFRKGVETVLLLERRKIRLRRSSKSIRRGGSFLHECPTPSKWFPWPGWLSPTRWSAAQTQGGNRENPNAPDRSPSCCP